MGEAARRKKLDPNYGKIPIPPSLLANSWHEGKCLAFIRCVDMNTFKEILSSTGESFSVGQDSVGGDLIIYGGDDLFSFSLAKEWISLVLPTINERYKQMGRGLVNIVPYEIRKAMIGKTSPSHMEWNYYSKQEIISAGRNSLVLGSTKSMKPFLLWAINNYDPTKEIILLLCGFPISLEKAGKGGSKEELASNRFYGVVRHAIT